MKPCRYIILFLCIFNHDLLYAKEIVILKGSIQSLEQAIKTARAGDSIIIDGGTYYPQNTVVIDKPIFLIGIHHPIIDGGKKIEIMVIKSDFVIVQGLHFRNSGQSGYNDIAALRILQSGHILIRDNEFENCFFGLYSQHAYQTTIANNRFHSYGISEQSSANGIHCWKSEDMQILNNQISGHRDGIYFEFVTGSTIKGNTSTGNMRYGLHFMFSHNNWYIGNRFSNNGAGVAVMYSHHVHMHNNVFSNNWGNAAYGILMKEITDSHVEQNIFLENTVSIYMEGSNRIMVKHNQFTNNGWAIKIQASCTDNVINENNFSGNSFDIATNGSLQLNDFKGNYWDKYEGYDLNKDGIGDVPYRPVSLFSMIAERMPYSIMLFRSFMVMLLERTERAVPGLTPIDMKDDKPLMKAISL